jgi:hypothetical protein
VRSYNTQNWETGAYGNAVMHQGRQALETAGNTLNQYVKGQATTDVVQLADTVANLSFALACVLDYLQKNQLLEVADRMEK